MGAEAQSWRGLVATTVFIPKTGKNTRPVFLKSYGIVCGDHKSLISAHPTETIL